VVRAADILPDAADAMRAANAYVSDLLTPTIRLGVTGLARSGKTVFITALVRNLVGGGRLPFLSADAEGRLLRAYLEPQPDDTIPRFDYETHLAALLSERIWPDSTRRISQLRLTIEYEPKFAPRRWFGPASVHLDIVDYPGEWLLDLALLDQTYETWSAEALSLAREPQRSTASAAFMALLANLNPAGDADEQTAIAGAKLYTAYLASDRASDEAQATLGPGRFLMPGELEGSPLLTFFPMEPPAGTGKSRTLHSLMVRRFDSYKSHVVQPFFRDHFSRLDRQIVLIDVLGALNRGSGAVADLERALASVMAAFRPGADSWLSFLTGARIDRLLFAATKADHLHHSTHDRMEAILKQATRRAATRARTAGADVDVLAISAVRATREAEMTQGAETFPVILGVPLPGEMLDGQVFDGKTEVGVFPGDLPVDASSAFDTQTSRAGDQAFVRFRPPSLTSQPGVAGPTLPHIRLDKAIEFLIGDKLT
jgi:uncharacterized protein